MGNVWRKIKSIWRVLTFNEQFEKNKGILRLLKEDNELFCRTYECAKKPSGKGSSDVLESFNELLVKYKKRGYKILNLSH